MLKLSVVTPERSFLAADCMSVTLPGVLGEMQVLAGHAPCLVELATGTVIYEDPQGEVQKFMIAEGFAEVENSRVNLLCELARNKQEIDKSAQEKIQADLIDKINKASGVDEQEEKELKAELAQSVASLKLFD